MKKTLTNLPLTYIKETDAFETKAVVVENCENKTVCAVQQSLMEW